MRFGGKRLKPMLQGEAAECGLCCVGMLADYHGYSLDLITLRQKFNLSLSGASLRQIMDICVGLKLTPRPLRLELNDLKHLQLPAIVHWNLNHFVVVKRVSLRRVVVLDPAVGERVYSVAEFGHRFSGIALEVSPRIDFSAGEDKQTLKLSAFFRGARGLAPALIQILVLSALIQIFALATPFYIQVVVDDVLIKNDSDLLNLLALGFLALTLFSVATKTLRGFTSLYLANQLNYNVGNSVLFHLLRLPLIYFEKRHLGDVISRFGSTGPIQEFITSGAVAVVIDGVLAVSTLALMWIYAPGLTGVAVGALILYCLFRLAQYRPLMLAQQESINAGAKLDSHFMETIRALAGVKNAHREVERQTQWQHYFVDSINTEVKIGRLTLSYEAINNTLTGCEYVLIVYLGALEVLGGSMTVGMLYAFLAYRSHFSNAGVSLVNTTIQFKMLRLHLDRLADIVNTGQETGLSTDSAFSLPLTGQLGVRELAFRYSPGEPAIFKNFNLEVPAGQFVAIYGPSGVGKSTLLKNLMGLLQPTDGLVTLDGHPLKTLGIKSLRMHSASVLQTDRLFSGGIRENVSFFDRLADRQKIIDACKLACVHDEIMDTTMAYETRIGDMGASLSAGQQQRILIARALYRRPKFFFLDEGTAHIDAPRERQIMENLRRQQLTCIYVTHSLELLKYADQVVYWQVPDQPQVVSRSGLAEVLRQS